MSWLPAAFALIGTVIGAMTSVFTQRGLLRRQAEQQERNMRRELYGEYLTALYTTREELWAIAAEVKDVTHEELRKSAYEAFRGGQLYSVRAKVGVNAPAQVVEASTEAFRAMRDYRISIGNGYLRHSEEHTAALSRVKAGEDALRRAMRRDLGVT